MINAGSFDTGRLVSYLFPHMETQLPNSLTVGPECLLNWPVSPCNSHRSKWTYQHVFNASVRTFTTLSCLLIMWLRKNGSSEKSILNNFPRNSVSVNNRRVMCAMVSKNCNVLLCYVQYINFILANIMLTEHLKVSFYTFCRKEASVGTLKYVCLTFLVLLIVFIKNNNYWL